MFRFLFILVLLIASIAPTRSLYALGPDDEVKASLQISHRWLLGLREKSVDEVTQRLGKPVVESNWDFQGKSESLWEYKLPEFGASLKLFFFKGKVVSVSLHQQSED